MLVGQLKRSDGPSRAEHVNAFSMRSMSHSLLYTAASSGVSTKTMGNARTMILSHVCCNGKSITSSLSCPSSTVPYCGTGDQKLDLNVQEAAIYVQVIQPGHECEAVVALRLHQDSTSPQDKSSTLAKALSVEPGLPGLNHYYGDRRNVMELPSSGARDCRQGSDNSPQGMQEERSQEVNLQTEENLLEQGNAAPDAQGSGSLTLGVEAGGIDANLLAGQAATPEPDDPASVTSSEPDA